MSDAAYIWRLVGALVGFGVSLILGSTLWPHAPGGVVTGVTIGSVFLGLCFGSLVVPR